MSGIYLDNNATTPLLPAVWEAMRPYALEHYGNPASAHFAGRRARQALEDARERTASLLDASPDEVFFTSGGTEANNLAIFGLAGEPPARLLTSPIEHPSVREPIAELARHGFQAASLSVDANGHILPAHFPELMQTKTRLVSVMLANNETGAIQPIIQLVSQLPDTIHFHCDAVQAVGRTAVAFHQLAVTTLSLSAHKFHGPKGIAALLIRRGTRLAPRSWGGHQQQGKRPGTESASLAVGLATALELAVRDMPARNRHVLSLRERFLAGLRAGAAPLVLNGPQEGGIPHTLNISFPGCRADVLLMSLDLAGVACSTGSACSSGSLLPSPVLEAMGVGDTRLHSALRFSLSHLLTHAEIDDAAQRIICVVNRLRAG